ncbi:SDR family NAD(P)-dependent oxidoreductase [Salinisphaera sp.]|uniref:SDR family NAD(P)-dependent oxidoreductase n=1 Tax=Salinisphaera sp. TaxID=1914330 RepID=UPI002D76E3A2|nr:SDR family NAD(P)-dependent oxidoreductase [Salinisphaera sp.]HET7314587.1 SDR family NAD(P)-dependent oxidoreductase [Salinisphaera sp.]
MARNVLITGGNNGIGREMAAALAAHGDHVLIASRDLAKSQAATEAIRKADPDARIEAMALDLGDFADIDRFAEQLLQRMPTLDVLILNAGLYTHGTRALPNGLEAMIGIMHFGHFRLVRQLRDAVVAAPAGRIVVTASLAHRLGRLRFDNFDAPRKHRAAVFAYAQAKLANILFTRELAKRLADTPVTANCFHPGAVATGLWSELPTIIQRLLGSTLISPAEGADTGIWLATADAAREISGEYFVKRKPARTTAAARDMNLAVALWRDSEKRMDSAGR